MPDATPLKPHAHPLRQSHGVDEPVWQQRLAFDPSYVELAATSNFTFLEGASHPEEFASRAAKLNYPTAAIADRNTLAGVVRGHVAAQQAGIPFLPGCRVRFDDSEAARDAAERDAAPRQCDVIVYPESRVGYGQLCRLLTLGRRRAPKGQCQLTLADLLAHHAGLLAIVCPPVWYPPSEEEIDWAALRSQLQQLCAVFDDDRLSLGVTRLPEPDEHWRDRWLQLGTALGIPAVAINDAHYHRVTRRMLQDVMTCIRHGCTLPTAGYRLFPNADRHLKSAAEMQTLFADAPEMIARSSVIAQRASAFGLDQLRYDYPDEVCPDGKSPDEYLRDLTFTGAHERYGAEIPSKIIQQLEHELALIAELNYATYFLTVYDLVRFARSREILCQGRGGAANSAVCFCLGVTAVDPDRIEVLFERFISRERNEPPDIDIDFEHERREEVIQYVYEKYGRDRAALTGVVISYRSRSAVRDVGKALGLSQDAVGQLAKRGIPWRRAFGKESEAGDELREAGFDPSNPLMIMLVKLVNEIIGFPRHLSQHVGGFVMTQSPLCELVPIENAAMADRTVIEWDKDDLDALGILKVDVLGLGMLTCIRKGFELIECYHNRAFSLATIPAEDPRVYDAISAADTLGVFQIESRAQMTMLPRLQPRTFYDLVIEVAIVRPGPIQGDMVHPYLRRRQGVEAVEYPSEAVRGVLEKTLGVPLFQEQVMRLAVVAAGFTPGEADQLRRAMAAWKKSGQLEKFQRKLIDGMQANGYALEFAERLTRQIEGFGEYGFPESHAASFALLVYASAWMKVYYPAVFAAALLNSQPMGFYAPAQILRDAREHGVEVRPVDVNFSDWDCTLEDGGRAVRLGMRLVKGLGEASAWALEAAREAYGHFEQVSDTWQRSGLPAEALKMLAKADAFGSCGLSRQQGLWQVKALPERDLGLLDRAPVRDEQLPLLPEVSPLREVFRDYGRTGLSLKAHPMTFLRERMIQRRVLPGAEVKNGQQTPHGARAAVAGLVLFRQRPSTAGGTIFMTIEDETARVDLILRKRIHEQFKAATFMSTAVLARGRVERNGRVVHVLVDELEDLSRHLSRLTHKSRDFR